MGYCAFADPGQVKQTRKMKIGAVGGMDIEEGIPWRAHKSWQYSHPIRRYDHYCKWVKNVIGLLTGDLWHFSPNHREFVIMVAGLLLIGVLGIMVDIWLAILIAEKSFFKFEIVVALHLGYSVALLAIDGPIFKIHFGLISRNEMAQEWKNEHYVANNTRQRASRGSRGWWVQRALRPWRLCVRSHKEPFWQRLLHQLPKLLVPAFSDFRWEGGVLISHCYSYEAMCMGFTAVTKRSGIDGQNQGDLISRLAWSSECRRSKWLKGKKHVTTLNCGCECDILCFPIP